MSLLYLVSASVALVRSTPVQDGPFSVPPRPVHNVSGSPFEAYVSYSIELAFFPDFTGNRTHPNTFVNNLLDNIGELAGTKPYIRVGGSTQDNALYDANLTVPTSSIYNLTRSADQPVRLYLGPSFFDSYQIFPNTKFVHGFNLGLASASAAGWTSLIETVPVVCKALGPSGTLLWEYGNEPDFSMERYEGLPLPYVNESVFIEEWLNGTRAIDRELERACPELGKPMYMAPSITSPATRRLLDVATAFRLGLNEERNVGQISVHNYIARSNSLGITLKSTLLNHTSNVANLRNHIELMKNVSDTGIPYVLGEMNSLSGQGQPGLSNSFGAALWGIDFNLLSISVGVKRAHMHQGTDYRYNSFQPVQTNRTTKGTKAPYYGNVFVAAFLGDLSSNISVRVANIPLGEDPHEAAYALYTGDKLSKIAVINMHEYNSSSSNPLVNKTAIATRLARTYDFQIAGQRKGLVDVQRLYANGSDAITGITWEGLSYDYELDNGRPVRLSNITVGETTVVKRNSVRAEVEDSGAVILSFRH